MFTTPTGCPLNPRTDFDEWKRLLARAGVRDARRRCPAHRGDGAPNARRSGARRDGDHGLVTQCDDGPLPASPPRSSATWPTGSEASSGRSTGVSGQLARLGLRLEAGTPRGPQQSSRRCPYSVAVAVGFEPTEGVNPHTLSRSAGARPELVERVLVCGSSTGYSHRGPQRTQANETRTETTEDHRGCPPDNQTPAARPLRPERGRMLPTADKWRHRVPPELHVRAHPSQGLTIAGRWFAPSLLRQTAPGSCGIPSTWRSPTARRPGGSPRRNRRPTLCSSAPGPACGSPWGGRRGFALRPSRRSACPARACTCFQAVAGGRCRAFRRWSGVRRGSRPSGRASSG